MIAAVRAVPRLTAELRVDTPVDMALDFPRLAMTAIVEYLLPIHSANRGQNAKLARRIGVASLALCMVCASANASLVARYTFDDALNLAADSSGFGRNGTYQLGGDGDQAGDADFTASAIIGTGAARFSSSNDWISLPNDAALQPTNTLSVAFWMRMTSLGSSFTSIVRHDGHFTAMQPHAGVLGTQTWSGGSVDYNNWPTADFTTATDGQWHHFAVVFEYVPATTVTTLKGYLDGQERGMITSLGTFSGPLNTTTRTWALGATETATEQWAGDLDDLRIYDHALTASEVQAITTNVPEPAETMLLLTGGAMSFFMRRRRVIRRA